MIIEIHSDGIFDWLLHNPLLFLWASCSSLDCAQPITWDGYPTCGRFGSDVPCNYSMYCNYLIAIIWFNMDAENSTIPSTAMPRLLAQIMVFHHAFSTFCVFPWHFVNVFHCFLFSQLHLAAIHFVEGWTFGVARQPGSSRAPTLESIWKFTQITGAVHLTVNTFLRLTWLMVEPMISIFDSRIMSLCTDDKWLGRSALEAKCSSLLDKASSPGGLSEDIEPSGCLVGSFQMHAVISPAKVLKKTVLVALSNVACAHFQCNTMQ